MKCPRIVFPLLLSVLVTIPHVVLAMDGSDQNDRIPVWHRLEPRPDLDRNADIQAHRAALNENRLSRHNLLMRRAQNPRFFAGFRTTSFLKLANAYIDEEIQDKTHLRRDFEDLNNMFPLAEDDRETDVRFALGKLAFFAGEHETAYRHYQVAFPRMQGSASLKNHISIALAQLILAGGFTPPGCTQRAALEYAQELLGSTHSDPHPAQPRRAAPAVDIEPPLQVLAQPADEEPALGAVAVPAPEAVSVHYDDLRTTKGQSLRRRLEGTALRRLQRRADEAAAQEARAVVVAAVPAAQAAQAPRAPAATVAVPAAPAAQETQASTGMAVALAVPLIEQDDATDGGGGSNNATLQTDTSGTKRKRVVLSQSQDEPGSQGSAGKDRDERPAKRRRLDYTTREIQLAILNALRTSAAKEKFDARDIQKALEGTAFDHWKFTQLQTALSSIRKNPSALTPEEAQEYNDLYERRKSRSHWSDKDKQMLVRLAREGKSATEIAASLKTTRSRVSKYKRNLLRKKNRPACISEAAWRAFKTNASNRWKSEEVLTLIRLASEGWAAKQIAKDMGKQKSRIKLKVATLRNGGKLEELTALGLSDEEWERFLSLKGKRGRMRK